MITNLDQLAKFVKGGAEVLQKAISSEEEVSIELVEGSFVSDTDLEQLKESRFNDGKKEGQTIGYDFAMKDLKKDFSIEIEGKDRSKIVEAIQNKIISDAKIEPDKKVNELKQSLENLQKQYTTDLESKDRQLTDLNSKLFNFQLNGDLNKYVPEKLNGIDKDDFLTIAKTSASFDYEDGQLVVKQGDKVLRDKMEKPISVGDYLTQYAAQKNWLNGEGRGAGDSAGGSNAKFSNINEVFKHLETNNIQPTSPEGQRLIDEFNAKNN